MTWFCKGECSRLPAQHKKMTFDQASVCIKREYGKWRYQKMTDNNNIKITILLIITKIIENCAS